MADDITRQIKDFALAHTKIDKIGIASADRFSDAPAGFHPEDFLPGVRSVIVCAVRLPDGAVQVIMRMNEDKLTNAHGIYGSYGYVGGPNYTLLFAADRIARFTEDLTGEIAVPCPSGPTHGAKMLSIKHSAVAAGLGEFGWHSIVITPEFGTRNRFVTIMTTAELEPDPLYSGPALCNPDKCGVCSVMCPSGAIPKYDANHESHSVSCDIGGRTYTYCGLNFDKCQMTGAGAYRKPGEDKDEFENVGEMMGYYARHPNNNFFIHFNSWKCGYCLAYCPAGDWKGRFYDTGLSRVDTEKLIRE
jgi:epoxyqueuosine reductase QueG